MKLLHWLKKLKADHYKRRLERDIGKRWEQIDAYAKVDGPSVLTPEELEFIQGLYRKYGPAAHWGANLEDEDFRRLIIILGKVQELRERRN